MEAGLPLIRATLPQPNPLWRVRAAQAGGGGVGWAGGGGVGWAGGGGVGWAGGGGVGWAGGGGSVGVSRSRQSLNIPSVPQ